MTLHIALEHSLQQGPTLMQSRKVPWDSDAAKINKAVYEFGGLHQPLMNIRGGVEHLPNGYLSVTKAWHTLSPQQAPPIEEHYCIQMKIRSRSMSAAMGDMREVHTIINARFPRSGRVRTGLRWEGATAGRPEDPENTSYDAGHL